MGMLRIISLNHNFYQQCRQLHLLKNKAFINNNWVSAQSKAVFPIMNPVDDTVITEVPDMEPSDAKLAIKAAADTFKTWKQITPKERSKTLRRWFDICEKNSDYLAEIVSAETGKPILEAKAEVAYGNSYIEWFSECARHINGEIISSPWPNKHIMVTRHPVGVVSVITPWNFPFAMITRKVAALMAAGCTCVIKPSEDTPLSALAAADLAEKAGVPKGIINVVTASRKNSPELGIVLCQDNDVKCISFTGSTNVGKILYGHAAKGIKRVSLELGGNAPFIVMPSADIKHTLEQAMLAKFRNNGQACIGANRFLVHEDIYDEFVCGFKELIAQRCVLGPPNKKGVTCGPIINTNQVNNISALVNDAVKNGATALIGAEVDESLGNKFYKSTLLTNVKTDMKIFNVEIFGPIAQVLKIISEEEALDIANNVACGLAAYVFTKDLGQAFRMSQQLNSGMVAINDGIISAAEAPFGGIMESGIGREGSLHGVLEYTDMKYTLMSGLAK